MSSLPPDRRQEAYDKRVLAAQSAKDRPHSNHENNGEENEYSNKIASFSKGLPHDEKGEVTPQAYTALVNALNARTPNAFENIQLGGGQMARKLVNPAAGLSYDLEGPDSHHVRQPKTPKISDEDGAAEIAELYWMSLLRDIDFSIYHEDERIEDASKALRDEFPNYQYWPKENGRITPRTTFRGNFIGDSVGPYISQFMLKGNEDKAIGREEQDGYVKYGTASIDQRHVVAIKGLDFLTDYKSWLKVQNGENTNVDPLQDEDNDNFEGMPRFITNMRDLATYVHFDALYQAYLTALFYMLRAGFPFGDGIPYGKSGKQEGFGTFGGPHILALVCEVSSRALKAVWLQKWYVHHRLRPEAFSGLIHNHKTGKASYPTINNKILDSPVLEEVFERNGKINRRYDREDKDGTYLLSQAFPEGSPIHPSYGAGHATVAGACVTILKAWFKEGYRIEDPVEPNRKGTRLRDYEGPGKNDLTVLGELNKLAANVAIGRNMAGVHYRSDYVQSVKLGEEVAIGILKEQKMMHPENPTFKFTKFDGNQQII